MYIPKFLRTAPDLDRDINRTIGQIIASRGFIFEEHHVTTEDGYILTIHRIINPSLNYNQSEIKPVLMMHGLASYSDHWLIASNDGHFDKSELNPVSNNLAFALANCGYDVWLGNCRGNQYGRKHTSLNHDESSFWDFSLDEVVNYDLPNTIDYITKLTNQSKLRYIGFSQGTIIMFALLSSQPRFNDVIKPFIALAPIASYKNNSSPSNLAVKLVIKTIGRKNGVVAPVRTLRRLTTNNYLRKIFQCQQFLTVNLSLGLNWRQVNWSRMDDVMSRPFGDVSWKSFRHHVQVYDSGHLRRFDHGKELNRVIYGDEVPPDYDLSRISCKYIGLMYGRGDRVTTEKDLDVIRTGLRNTKLIFDHPVEDENWSHTDFHFGKDLATMVNCHVIKILQSLDLSDKIEQNHCDG